MILPPNHVLCNTFTSANGNIDKTITVQILKIDYFLVLNDNKTLSIKLAIRRK